MLVLLKTAIKCFIRFVYYQNSTQAYSWTAWHPGVLPVVGALPSKLQNTNRLFILCLFTFFGAHKWLRLCCRPWWIITMMKKNSIAWMTTTIGVSGGETRKKVTFSTISSPIVGLCLVVGKNGNARFIVWIWMCFLKMQHLSRFPPSSGNRLSM